MQGSALAKMPDFPSFFEALWGHKPFPWQRMLADLVSSRAWPQVLDLPTASGKTACIDIAIYALASQAEQPLGRRTAPRRIWFVVDRRIVVDEAFERAARIAEKLEEAKSGPLRAVADRLRSSNGTKRPLAVARLRGGTLRDDGWARIPSQATVITSTVDQVGSRLLFRGYGHSLLTAPVFAGLVANDSLVILDEAHCAVPFMQTLEAIRRYRSERWAAEPIPSPFGFVVMSATPPRGIPQESVFPGRQRQHALDHPELARRLATAKLAELVLLSRRGNSAPDPLISEATARAAKFVRDGKRRVAVMVNRVRTAVDLAGELGNVLSHQAHVVLLTGRIRPLERDRLVEYWTRFLRARDPEDPELPVVVVATQCLEVGADFSFEALITECASLDALRQRFGRLARLGSHEPAPAAILIREAEAKGKRPDPIYGEALAKTWEWLVEQADKDAQGHLVVDMGVEALESRLREVEDVSPYFAPNPQAPMLLPAHLDLLCQTSEPAHPEPDVSLYLHGQPSAPEVSVVWRADLPPAETPNWEQSWEEIVALCPPTSSEMLQVPLWLLRSWLAQKAAEGLAAGDFGDVEGSTGEAEQLGESIRPCVVWRGRDRSKVARWAREIKPGDVVVLPAAYGIEGLGQAVGEKALGPERLDLWEVARMAAGYAPGVRLHPAILNPWLTCPPLADLVALAKSPAPDPEKLDEAIQAVLDYRQQGEDSPPPPPLWWLELLAKARGGRVVGHPDVGLILFARTPKRPEAEPDLFADDDDLTSAADREVTLAEHADLVARAALLIAERCLPPHLHRVLEIAARWHDAGKLDPRFQVLLRQGDEIAAAAAPEPIAKSASVPSSPLRRRAIREAVGLPENFRHEMLSLELAKAFAKLPEDPLQAELVLHLISSHHGYARPFAPVAPDASPPPVRGVFQGMDVELESQARLQLVPAYRVDSGVPERFWRLTRRYGWWGLAYLEALLRLADWYASNFAVTAGDGGASS
jgi:CRISPR-associated endonuclease/helicase Cas3